MVTLILKSHKDFIMNENFRPIFLMNNDAKKYSQTEYVKNIIHMIDPCGFHEHRGVVWSNLASLTDCFNVPPQRF